MDQDQAQQNTGLDLIQTDSILEIIFLKKFILENIKRGQKSMQITQLAKS